MAPVPMPALPARSPDARRSTLVGLAVGILALMLGVLTLRHHESRNVEKLRAEAGATAQIVLTRLVAAVHSAEHAAATLAIFPPQDIASQEEFARHAKLLIELSGQDHVLEWAPQGMVRFIHPLPGNEQAVGLDLRTDPRSRELVEKSLASGTARWDGPFGLRQGGLGMVYRKPVYEAGEIPSAQSFLGFAICLVNLTASMELLASHHRAYDFQAAVSADQGETLDIWNPTPLAPSAAVVAATAQTRLLAPDSPAATRPGVTLRVSVWPREMTGSSGLPVWSAMTLGALLLGVLAHVLAVRRAAQAALRESNAKFRDLWESNRDAQVLMLPPEWKLTNGNAAFDKLLGGQGAANPAAFTLRELSPERQPDGELSAIKSMRHIEQALRAGTAFFEWTHRRPEGRELPCEVSLARVTIDGVTGIQASIRDLTLRRQAEAARDELLASTNDLIQRIAPDGRIVYVNEAWCRALGYTRQEAQALNFKEVLHPDLDPACLRVLAGFKADDPVRKFAITLRAKAGQRVELEGDLGPSAIDGQLTARGIFRDVTARNAAAQALERLLAERTTLLEEIHHRVKNNLMVVASLLALQQRQSESPEVVAQLQVSRDRIAAIALVHEQLYGNERFDRIDFLAYLEQLCVSLMQTSGAQERGLMLQIGGTGFPLALPEAVPCSLLINELVGNAFKHAFPAGRPGRVWVELSVGADGRRLIKVGDDGIGMPQQARRSGSLGLKLVERLTNQLRGGLTREQAAIGTLYCLWLPAVAEDATEGGGSPIRREGASSGTAAGSAA